MLIFFLSIETIISIPSTAAIDVAYLFVTVAVWF
jgi:hypothetical protein